MKQAGKKAKWTTKNQHAFNIYSMNDYLEFAVWDYNLVKDEVIGQNKLMLQTLIEHSGAPHWYVVEHNKLRAGSVMFKIIWMPKKRIHGSLINVTNKLENSTPELTLRKQTMSQGEKKIGIIEASSESDEEDSEQQKEEFKEKKIERKNTAQFKSDIKKNHFSNCRILLSHYTASGFGKWVDTQLVGLLENF